jgi:hypothetical protein
MPKLTPLIKIISIANLEDASDIFKLPYKGGGAKITNSIYNTKQSKFKIQKNVDSKLKVGYTNTFEDTYGLRVTLVEEPIIDSYTGVVERRIIIQDSLVKDPVSWLTSIQTVTVNLPATKNIAYDKLSPDPSEPEYIAYIILNPLTSVQTRFDIDNPTHIEHILLYEYGNSKQPIARSSINIGDELQSFESLINQRDFSATRSVNKVKESLGYTNIDPSFGGKQELTINIPTKTYDPITKSEGIMYGPASFISVLIIDDLENTSKDRTKTRFAVEEVLILDGIELLQVNNKYQTNTNICNITDTLQFKISIPSKFRSNITEISLLGSSNVEDVVMKFGGNKDGDYFIINDTGDDTGDFLIDVPLAEGDWLSNNYQGPIFGYVQCNNITWSPKSIFQTSLVYDTTNDPLTTDGYVVTHTDGDVTSINISIDKFKHATDIPHQVIIVAVADPTSSGDSQSITFDNVSANDFRRNGSINNLNPSTLYNLQLRVDDGKNLTYTQDIGSVTTLTDDNEPPSIQFIHLVGHSDIIKLHCKVTDSKSPIVYIKHLTIHPNFLETFQSKDESEKKILIDDFGTMQLDNDTNDKKSEEFRVDIRKSYNNESTPNIEPNKQYTVYVFMKDDTGSGQNEIIALNTVTTHEPIDSSEITIEDTKRKELSVSTSFTHPGITQVEVYYGLYSTHLQMSVVTEHLKTTDPVTLNIGSSHNFVFNNSYAQNLPDVNEIVEGTSYNIVLYCKHIDNDISYDLYSNIFTYNYTTLDKSGPEIMSVSVSFDA